MPAASVTTDIAAMVVKMRLGKSYIYTQTYKPKYVGLWRAILTTHSFYVDLERLLYLLYLLLYKCSQLVVLCRVAGVSML